jgi:N-acetylneuraminate synthase
MLILRREFPDLLNGYSDHTLSTLACMCTTAMGAELIEKHYTYDKNADGPDHMLSKDFEETDELVKRIRRLPVMLTTLNFPKSFHGSLKLRYSVG